MAATIRVPKSRARLVEIEIPANPQTMFAYAMPITKGALTGDTNGLAGSRQAQMTMPLNGILAWII